MSELIRTAGQNAWLWRTIMFKFCNGWLLVVGQAIIAAHLFTPHQESWVAIILAGNKFAEGFLNQDIGRLKAEITAAFDTTHWRRVIPTEPLSPEPPKGPSKLGPWAGETKP